MFTNATYFASGGQQRRDQHQHVRYFVIAAAHARDTVPIKGRGAASSVGRMVRLWAVSEQSGARAAQPCDRADSAIRLGEELGTLPCSPDEMHESGCTALALHAGGGGWRTDRS